MNQPMKTMLQRDSRCFEDIRAHYLLEKKLAKRLREAGRAERRVLYPQLYAELFEKVPYFALQASDTEGRSQKVVKLLRFLHRFLSPDMTLLEVGAGDCALAMALCRQVKRVYALDVVHQVGCDRSVPVNLTLVTSDGTSVDVDRETIDIAFSNQLMEHLHPEDARDQLKSIYRALVPGGLYIVITPHRYCGPHDISMYFDEVATGFHLKEYTIFELHDLLKKTGFSRIRFFAKRKGGSIRLNPVVTVWMERLLKPLPCALRKAAMGIFPFKYLRRIRLAAEKRNG
jgi:SAM-dependent methyltransferase